MAQDKKSIILYCDIINTIEKLIKSDRENKTNNTGELFYHLLQYVNDEDPEPVNMIVDLTFEPIKQQLKRDLERWEEIREKRSLAGQKSAEARAKKNKGEQIPTNPTSVKSVEQTSTNSTVNVNVNDNVNVINNIYSFYPSVCPYSKRSLSKNSKNKDKIKTLLKTKTAEDLENIIKGYLLNVELSNKDTDFKTPLKNFQTFLNNLPELTELRAEWQELSKTKQPTQKDKYEQKRENATKFH